MSTEEKLKTGYYFNIIDGTFRTKAEEGDPEAVKREWKTPDGKSGVKYERVLGGLTGLVKDIGFYDGDYGKNLQITLDENQDGKQPIISLSVSSNYAEGIMKRLPNADLSKEINFRPYAFEDDEGKTVRGIELKQKDDEDKWTVKLGDFFHDAETKTAKNGYPIPEGDTKSYSTDDWKIFFLTARKFLIQYTVENIVPKVKGSASGEYPDEEAAADKF